MHFADDEDVWGPPVWWVCFCKKTVTYWLERFLRPGFRHVFLLGYVPRTDVWLFYDSGRDMTTVACVSRERAAILLATAKEEGAILRYVPDKPEKAHPILGRAGFWCSRAVAHVLGLRCVAVTPRALHDYLLKIGATPVRGDSHGTLRNGDAETATAPG